MNKEEVIDLIKDAGYGVLATLDEDEPKVRPMMPYVDEDSGNLLIATFTQKRVIGQIRKNSNVEMCFIDRKMNFARISGQATVSEVQEKKELIWNNIPMLRQFFSGPDDPNMIIIEIDSQKVEAMTPQSKEPEVISIK